MRYLALVLCLIPSLAFGQASVRQDGSVTRNDAAKWSSDHIIKDAGGINGDNTGVGVNPFAITDNNGPGVCSNSGPTNQPYNQICLGHDANGVPYLSTNAEGGAPPTGFYVIVNGAAVAVPGSVTGMPQAISNAALQGTSTSQYSSIVRLGFNSPGDAPALFYTASNAPCSLNSGAGDNGSQVKSADGKCFIANFPNDVLNVTEFGADPTGANDSTAAVQAAVNAAAGRIVHYPAGTFKQCSAITSNSAVQIEGVGNGQGPGGILPLTKVVLCGATQDGFDIHSSFQSVFRNFNLTSAVVQTGGVGLNFTNNETTTVGPTVIVDMSFGSVGVTTYVNQNLYNPVKITTPDWPTFDRVYCQGWTFACISLVTVSGTEGSGGRISHSYFFGNPLNSWGQGPAIYSEVGYTDIHDNEILAGTKSVQFAIRNNNAGFVKVHDNTIENSTSSGVDVSSLDGSTVSHIMIQHNEFSNFAYAGSMVAHVIVHEYLSGGNSQTGIYNDIQVSNNVFLSSLPPAAKYIWIQAGTNIAVTNNQIHDVGTSNPYAIQFSGATSNTGYVPDLLVADNEIENTTSAYNLTISGGGVLLRDVLTGVSVASLSGLTAKPGSQVWVPDGTIGSVPCTTGGPGSVAFRLGSNQWKCL